VFKEPPPPNNVPDKIQQFSVPLNNEFVGNAAPENLALDIEPDINGRKLFEDEDELDLENAPLVTQRRRDRVAPAAAGRISPSSRPPELGKKSQHVILSLASSFSRNDVLLQPTAGNLTKNLPKHAHKVTEVSPDAGSNPAMDRSKNRSPGQSVKGLHEGKNKTSRDAVTPVMSNAAAVTQAMANSSVTRKVSRKVVTHVFHKSSMIPVTLDAKHKPPTVSPTTKSLGQPPGMNQSKNTNTSVPATKISNSKVSKGGKVSFNPIVTAERKLLHASTNGTAKTSDDGGKFIYINNKICHRVYRVPGFLTVVRTGSPIPSPASECCPSPLGPRGETHSLAGDGMEVTNSDEGTDLTLLYFMYTLIPLRV
jgi:hypothetical protein